MNIRKLAQLVVCGCAGLQLAPAQAADPELMRQVSEVKAALASNSLTLRQYIWIEQTEVSIKGDVKSSTEALCHYDGFGELQKKPLTTKTEPGQGAMAKSNRPSKRKKADMMDYIDRAVSLVHTYLPPKPDRLQYLLSSGGASFRKTPNGEAEITLVKYWKEGDLLTFTFDPQTKALHKVNVKSYLADEKDPITMEALFEALPDGTNHLASSLLNGEAKKIQVKTQNLKYQKVAAQ